MQKTAKINTASLASTFIVFLPWMAGAVWVCALSWLMIAPVWDEIVFVQIMNEQSSLSRALLVCWTSYTLYRPLMTSLLATVLALLPFDYAWPLLRIVNMLLIITASLLSVAVASAISAERFGGQLSRQMLALYWLAIFSSPAVMVVGGWYANIFDASCFFFAVLGIWFVSKGRACAAGFALGCAWFCKEAAVFILPMIAYCYFALPKQRAILLKAFAIYIFFGAIYWAMRSIVVPLGSQHDIHAISWHYLLPALKAFSVRIWMPGVSSLPAIAGIGASLLVMVLARSRLFAGLAVLVYLCGTVVYAGMLPGDNVYTSYPLISPVIFAARLFYVPAGILLFGLLVTGRRAPLVFVCLIYLISLPLQFSWQGRLQQAYQNFYVLGEKTPSGVAIHINKDSSAQVMPKYKNVIIGDVPNADYQLNEIDGSLTPLVRK